MVNYLTRYCVSLLLFSCISASLLPVARAHEFWIEPLAYKTKPQEKLIANIKNGENFSGTSFVFLTDSFRQFKIYDQHDTRDIVSRLGDLPAVNETPKKSGLHVLFYESQNNVLKYDSFEKFKEFAEMQDVAWILNEHKRQKLPTEHVTEIFLRYAKSLVVSGTVDGNDRNVGMELEWIAKTNPYMQQPEENLQFLLLYQGEPLPATQAILFYKTADQGVTSSVYRTDDAGVVTFLTKRAGSYLLSAVVARRLSAARMLATGANWETLWASSTFGRLE